METTKMRLTQLVICAVVLFPLSFYVAVYQYGRSYMLGAAAGVVLTLLTFFFLAPRYPCARCRRTLNPFVVVWDNELDMDARLRLESYVDTGKIHRCRKCERLYCLSCAMATHGHCRFCDSWGFATGYFSKG